MFLHINLVVVVCRRSCCACSTREALPVSLLSPTSRPPTPEQMIDIRFSSILAHQAASTGLFGFFDSD